MPPPSRGNGAGPSGNEGFFPPDIGGLGSLALAAADAAEQAAAEGDTPGGSSDGAPGSWVPPPRPGPPVPLPLPSGDDFADAARTRVSLAGGSFVGRQRTSGPGLSRLAAGLGGKGSPAGGGGGPSYLTIPLNAEAAAAQGKAGGGRLGGGGGGVDTGSLVPSKAQLSTAEVQVIQTIVSSVHGPDLSHVVQGILQHIVRNYHPHWHAPPSAPGRKGS